MTKTEQARQKARNDFFPKIVHHRDDLIRLVSTKKPQANDLPLIISALQFTLAEMIFWDTERIENLPLP
jgi:hypothetical protein